MIGLVHASACFVEILVSSRLRQAAFFAQRGELTLQVFDAVLGVLILRFEISRLILNLHDFAAHALLLPTLLLIVELVAVGLLLTNDQLVVEQRVSVLHLVALAFDEVLVIAADLADGLRQFVAEEVRRVEIVRDALRAQFGQVSFV